MADVTLTVDGKKLTAPAGTLLIEACRKVGIEIPAFCYYPGLSLQAACRMCLVRIEKMPKLQTACTTPIAEGMIVSTETDEIKQARKSMLELLLANHPLDCPVCDAGGECELQDMTFKYGAGGSKFVDIKNHRDEQQWSPVVFFDRRRARHSDAQLKRGDCPERSDFSRLRTVRHVHRHLPGGRTDFRHLSIQNAALGDDARRNDLHALRGWLQDNIGSAPQ
jgi:hypothetical protein